MLSSRSYRAGIQWLFKALDGWRSCSQVARPLDAGSVPGMTESVESKAVNWLPRHCVCRYDGGPNAHSISSNLTAPEVSAVPGVSSMLSDVTLPSSMIME
jgi:hypothetical protein